jgi:hypothetical protein
MKSSLTNYTLLKSPLGGFRGLLLTLFLLTVGLLGSSKQTSVCHTKCDSENTAIQSVSSGGGSFGSDIEKPITPGNFLFIY